MQRWYQEGGVIRASDVPTGVDQAWFDLCDELPVRYVDPAPDVSALIIRLGLELARTEQQINLVRRVAICAQCGTPAFAGRHNKIGEPCSPGKDIA